jgi:hypothetical protein
MSSVNINNNFQYPNLPVSIIWPLNPDDIPWFMQRLYEQLAFAINEKDNGIFTMAIPGNSLAGTPALAAIGAVQIPNVDAFGAYLVCISGTGIYVDPATGQTGYWPSEVFSLVKSDPLSNVNTYLTHNSTEGTGFLTGADYIVSVQQAIGAIGPTYPYYFFIKHNKDGITGSFNVNIQGTQ